MRSEEGETPQSTFFFFRFQTPLPRILLESRQQIFQNYVGDREPLGSSFTSRNNLCGFEPSRTEAKQNSAMEFEKFYLRARTTASIPQSSGSTLPLSLLSCLSPLYKLLRWLRISCGTFYRRKRKLSEQDRCGRSSRVSPGRNGVSFFLGKSCPRAVEF